MNQPLIVPRLADLLDSRPGQIMMKGQRFLLINADALGTLRRDLVSTLGRDRAKGFLLRYGWSCGYGDALAVRDQFHDTSDLLLQEQGPILHMLEGVAHVKICSLEVNLEQDHFFFEGTWLNSYEAEQHARHFGTAEDSVCWTLVGYAGGYSTGLFNRKILYKEVACVGSGDDHCRFVGRTVEAWGDEIHEELPYYEQSMIAEELDEAYRHIQQQHQFLKKIMSIHEQLNRMVLAGFDRQIIIKTVGQMLDSPVIVEDRHTRPLVWWLPPDSGADLQHYLLGPALERSASLQTWLGQIKREKRAGDWIPSGDDVGEPARTTAPMILGDEVMGYLSVIHVDGDTNVELRRMIAERAAAAMELDLLRERTKLETELRLRGEFLDTLLDESTTVESLENRARYMDRDFQRPHRFLLIDIAPPYSMVKTTKDHEQFLLTRKELFNIVYAVEREMHEHVMVVERPQGLLLLAQTGDTGVDSTKLAREILDRQRKSIDRLSISICISQESRSIEQLRSAFSNCRNTLDVMTRLGRHNDIFYTEEMSVFDLLYAGPSQDQVRSFAHRTVSDLLDYDETYGGELTQTLYAFLVNECNLQRTARALNISLSGLKYRLQRLREIGKFDLDDSNERFNLQLALRILLATGKITFETIF